MFARLDLGTEVNAVNQDKPWMIALYIGGAGFMLAAYITVGFFIGKYAVHQFAAPNYWLAIGCLVGLILGIANIILFIKKFVGEDNG